MVFHHALKIVPDLCTGCTHCMKACPTEAIRVRNGLAEIFEERCVDCGECYKACPVSAIIIEQDDFEEIYEYKHRVALLPSVFIGQFPSQYNASDVFGAIKLLGFTHIFEIERVVNIVQEGYDQFINNYKGTAPVISTFCPAVLRLIQVRFPSLVDKLIRIKPPSDIAALYITKQLAEEGFNPDEIGVFYVTPCAAKIASIKSPVGEIESAVSGVINMQYLYNRLLYVLANNEFKPGQHDNSVIDDKGILWSLTRGESSNQSGRSLAVDGISNVTHFLEKLEEAEECKIDFLELRACDESCAGGVLISGNRFLTVERLNSRARQCKSDTSTIDKSLFDYEKHGLQPIRGRSMLILDQDRDKAIGKINKVDDLLKVLPGIDCSACGSPTCRALAEDIVQGRAELTYCIFLQELYMKNGKISLEEVDSINASIWGNDRNYRSQII